MKKITEIYECANPFWLSDIFIFKVHKNLGTVYVKINCHNKIEEIGVDIERRMHNTSLEDIKKKDLCKPATKFHRSILNRIGDEYWYMLFKQMPVEPLADTINKRIHQRLVNMSISNRLRTFIDNNIKNYINNEDGSSNDIDKFNSDAFINDLNNYIFNQ